MKHNLLFELSKTKKNSWVVLNVASLVQLASLYFFTVVGRFDTSSTDDILTSYSGIAGLASTITMCVSAIYGAIIINRQIVTSYIGDSRLRLYLYPSGRGKLYIIKNLAFVTSFSMMQLVGTLFGNALYVLGECFFPVMVSPVLISANWLGFITSSIVCTLLTLSIVLLSSIVGIRISSPVATIVTGIILIAFGGNLMAMSFSQYQNFTLVATLLISVLIFVGVMITAARINKDEVF